MKYVNSIQIEEVLENTNMWGPIKSDLIWLTQSLPVKSFYTAKISSIHIDCSFDEEKLGCQRTEFEFWPVWVSLEWSKIDTVNTREIFLYCRYIFHTYRLFIWWRKIWVPAHRVWVLTCMSKPRVKQNWHSEYPWNLFILQIYLPYI